MKEIKKTFYTNRKIKSEGAINYIKCHGIQNRPEIEIMFNNRTVSEEITNTHRHPIIVKIEIPEEVNK